MTILTLSVSVLLPAPGTSTRAITACREILGSLDFSKVHYMLCKHEIQQMSPRFVSQAIVKLKFSYTASVKLSKLLLRAVLQCLTSLKRFEPRRATGWDGGSWGFLGDCFSAE